MSHGSQTPEPHDDGKGDAVTKPIGHSAGNHQPNRVGKLKRTDDVPILCFRPTDGVLKRGCQKTEYLTIHIVYGCRKKEHGANRPAHPG
jgi:hypothetical protein